MNKNNYHKDVSISYVLGIDNGIEVLNSVYCQKDFTKFIKMAVFGCPPPGLARA